MTRRRHGGAGFWRAAHVGDFDGLRRGGLSVVVVEGNTDLVTSIADGVPVMDYGQTLFEGAPDELRRHPAVIAAISAPTSHERAADDRRARDRLWRRARVPRSYPGGRSGRAWRSSAPT